MPYKYSISCCIPTLNEEKNIARCIESVKDWVDEVVVLDSASKDRTVEIARSLGARVETRQWDNTAGQFSFLFALAKNEWVLHLDADEVCSESLQCEIKSMFDSGEIWYNDAYLVNRKTFVGDKWIRRCGFYPNFGVRIFRKNKIKLSCKGFHHNIVVFGKMGKLPSDAVILHYSAINFGHYLEKINRETNDMAKWRYEIGEKFSLLKLMFKSSFNFFKTYILKKGFLDGKEGFFISIFSALYIVLQYIKLSEFGQKGKKTHIQD